MAPQILVQAAALLVAIAFVMVCLQAMRVGLLTRFLGYLGIFAGVMVIIPVVQLPVVQAYWLGAVAYLLTGRWPSGVPKAWSTGRAEPWPSASAMREQRAEGIRRQGRARPGRKPAPPRSRSQSPRPSPRGRPAPTHPSASASGATRRTGRAPSDICPPPYRPGRRLPI